MDACYPGIVPEHGILGLIVLWPCALMNDAPSTEQARSSARRSQRAHARRHVGAASGTRGKLPGEQGTNVPLAHGPRAVSVPPHMLTGLSVPWISVNGVQKFLQRTQEAVRQRVIERGRRPPEVAAEVRRVARRHIGHAPVEQVVRRPVVALLDPVDTWAYARALDVALSPRMISAASSAGMRLRR